MAKKKLVEHNALVQAIEMGRPQEAVMEAFGIKSAAALKTAYYNALVALGKVPGLNNSRTKKKKKIDTVVNINNRGSLVIPKQLVDQLALDPSARFSVEKNDSGLVLRIVQNPPKTILKKRAAAPKS